LIFESKLAWILGCFPVAGLSQLAQGVPVLRVAASLANWWGWFRGFGGRLAHFITPVIG
jgi:hypothetical protein